jgi:transcriptional regulator with XRE-family HTH domain
MIETTTKGALTSHNPVAIGRVLRDARKKAKFTQEEVAAWIGVARTTLLAIENGQRRIRIEELSILAQKYDIDIHDLLDACEAEQINAEFLTCTPAQKRVLHRILAKDPDLAIVPALQLFGISQEHMEDVACALIHMLVSQEDEKSVASNGITEWTGVIYG